jgi:DNA-binding transcriptional regulator LsrR (DeoR family)
MARRRGWHPSEEDDGLVFAACDRFLAHLNRHFKSSGARSADGDSSAGVVRPGDEEPESAGAIADWLNQEFHRNDITRERIYPLFWEAARRKFLFLQPPRELDLAKRIAALYDVDQYARNPDAIQVVNARGPDSLQHVAAVGTDVVLSLIKRLEKKKREAGHSDLRVHIGLGGGATAMMVAERLASRIRSDLDCPRLVLHALSTGGFLVDQPKEAPVTYFSYFHDVLHEPEYVGLFSATVVPSGQYEQVIASPGVRESFDRANEIDIVITSFASAEDPHGLLKRYLQHLIEKRELNEEALPQMDALGWVGDVQFRPYTARGPMYDGCPVRAVTLFELSDLVEMAKRPDKYVVLLAGPCHGCSRTKTKALAPLLRQPNLRLWTHLVSDLNTAHELVKAGEEAAATAQDAEGRTE